MKINAAFVCFIAAINLVGCHSKDLDVTDFKADGIPADSQEFTDIHFVDEDTGYAFGTSDHASSKPLPGYSKTGTPLFVMQEATVFKTNNGGRFWRKTHSFKQRAFFGKSALFNQTLYIGASDFFHNQTFLTAIPFIGNSSESQVNSLYNIFANDSAVFYSEQDKLVNLKSQSAVINCPLGNELVIIDSTLFTIIQNQNESVLAAHKQKTTTRIDIPLFPFALTKISAHEILVAGRSKTDPSKGLIVRLNTVTNNWQTIASMDNHATFRDFQSNGSLVVALATISSRALIAYDLVYSTDSGATWSIEPLIDDGDIQASHLVHNTLFILSTLGNMQKVHFPANPSLPPTRP